MGKVVRAKKENRETFCSPFLLPPLLVGCERKLLAQEGRDQINFYYLKQLKSFFFSSPWRAWRFEAEHARDYKCLNTSRLSGQWLSWKVAQLAALASVIRGKKRRLFIFTFHSVHLSPLIQINGSNLFFLCSRFILSQTSRPRFIER